MTLPITIDDIHRWDAGDVREVFDATRSQAEADFEAADGLATLPAFEDFGGDTADAARDSIGQTRRDLDSHGNEASAVAHAASIAADRIEQVKADLAAVENEALDANLIVDPVTNRVIPGPGFPLTVLNLLAVKDKMAELQARLDTVLAEANEVDDDLARAINMAIGQAPIPETPPLDLPIPVGKSPEEVHRWWDSLSEDQHNQLLRTRPEILGNLDGIPVEGRSEANITVMGHDIARVENATSALSQDEMTRYYNALEVRNALRENSADTGGTPTYLLVYKPEEFGGQGRAAIAIGNPDTADDTVVHVPGTGNSVAGTDWTADDGWLSGPDAANVYNETVAANGSDTTSVVAWMGYNAPDSLTDPQVGQTGYARQGGALLAADVNALAVTNQGDSHVTVVGHSYGSTTVADAAADSGMSADDVVLVGSPGTDLADSAADFHLPEGGDVYVGAASTDPVTHLGGPEQAHIPGTDITVALGQDPAIDGYGSTRFKAEVPGNDWPWADHSKYFTPGTESLYSIADITSGNGDALQDHGMTAGHRDKIGAFGIDTPIEFDPELPRRATSGHYH